MSCPADVSNLLIFVSDALRYDSLPDSARDRGVTFKTIAQSTFSAPSFSTLATGRYPQEHGVMTFNASIAEDVPSIFDIEALDTTFFQADPEPLTLDNPIYPVLRREETRRITELSSPFLYMERDMTTHFPHDPEETAPSYLRSRRTDWDRIWTEYLDSVDDSVDRMQARLDALEDQGRLEDTLVILTSDHGELIGEYGEIAHITPMCPELIEVPTVFIHPSLSESDFETDPEASVVEHVDVVETALSALSEEVEFSTSGVDLFETDQGDTPGYSTVWYPEKSIAFLPLKPAVTKRPKWNFSRYEADGIWWKDGGYATVQGSTIRRLWFLLFRVSRSPHRFNLRPNVPELIDAYLPSSHAFGDPPVSLEEARDIIVDVKSEINRGTAETIELDEAASQQLEDLGYI